MNNATSRWGACNGSVGPAFGDSCTVRGDDANCDGIPNGSCQCIAGQGNAPCSQNPNASLCNSQGQCVPCQQSSDCSLVSGGRTFCDRGTCVAQLANGEACSSNQQCASGQCVLHYRDDDDDDYAAISAATTSFCIGAGFNKPQFTTRQPGVANQTDCLEGNATVSPRQTNTFTVRRNPNNASDPLPFDYNCDGIEQSLDPLQTRVSDCHANVSLSDCQTLGGWLSVADGGVGIPRCGETAFVLTCNVLTTFCDNYDLANSVRACR
jgi:hypothetical protein